MDGTDHFKMEVGLDAEYYLKIVSSEFVHPIWGKKPFFEFSHRENIVERDLRVPKIEFKYDFDPISLRHIKKRRGLM